MNKKITLSMIACCVITPAVHATNGYQLTGIGAYQKSLGGAVTAKPGSAMTAITNPAGMARIGKRADFSMEMFMPKRFVDFTAIPGGEKNDSAADLYGVPALGWTAPTSEGSDLFFGGGMYGTSGLGTDYPLTQFSAAGGGMPAMYFEGYSAIQFWQMAPTLAWNASDKLTYGVSLNIDYQSVAFKQGFLADTTGNGVTDTTMTSFNLSRTAQAFGYGLSLGVLYDISDDLTIGASYKSKQSFSTLKYQLSNGDIQDFTGKLPISGCDIGDANGDGNNDDLCSAGTYRLNLDFPAMYSVGMAYQLNKFTSLSLDVKQIEWSNTLDRLDVKGPNGELITLAAGWDDQTIIALGIEVAVNYALNVRAGYNKADAPFEQSSTDKNYILPAVTQSHFALGMDYRINRYWQIGMHASKATDETYTSPVTGAKIGLGITTFGINLGYLF